MTHHLNKNFHSEKSDQASLITNLYNKHHFSNYLQTRCKYEKLFTLDSYICWKVTLSASLKILGQAPLRWGQSLFNSKRSTFTTFMLLENDLINYFTIYVLNIRVIIHTFLKAASCMVVLDSSLLVVL